MILGKASYGITRNLISPLPLEPKCVSGRPVHSFVPRKTPNNAVILAVLVALRGYRNIGHYLKPVLDEGRGQGWGGGSTDGNPKRPNSMMFHFPLLLSSSTHALRPSRQTQALTPKILLFHKRSAATAQHPWPKFFARLILQHPVQYPFKHLHLLRF